MCRSGSLFFSKGSKLFPVNIFKFSFSKLSIILSCFCTLSDAIQWQLWISLPWHLFFFLYSHLRLADVSGSSDHRKTYRASNLDGIQPYALSRLNPVLMHNSITFNKVLYVQYTEQSPLELGHSSRQRDQPTQRSGLELGTETTKRRIIQLRTYASFYVAVYIRLLSSTFLPGRQFQGRRHEQETLLPRQGNAYTEVPHSVNKSTLSSGFVSSFLPHHVISSL